MERALRAPCGIIASGLCWAGLLVLALSAFSG